MINEKTSIIDLILGKKEKLHITVTQKMEGHPILVRAEDFVLEIDYSNKHPQLNILDPKDGDQVVHVIDLKPYTDTVSS